MNKTNKEIVFIPIAAYREDAVESQLSIEYIKDRPFNSIFGKLRSLKPIIWLINYDNFNPIYLTKPMSPKERTAWFKKRIKRFMPNGTEIFKLVVADRLLSDRGLLQATRNKINEIADGDIENVLLVPYIKIKRGIISVEKPNRNLKVFGIVLTRTLRIILDTFKDIDNIPEMDKDAFHDKKLIAKEKIWADAIQYAKEEPLLNNLIVNGDEQKQQNEELKERFMR